MHPIQVQDLHKQFPTASFIATLLSKLALEGNCLTESELTVFDAECIPPISLFEYLVRIQSLTRCEDELLVCSLSLIDRLIQR